MKKRFLSFLFALCFVLSANAATKLKFANGISLTFEGCTDNSIRFEAAGTKPNAPAKAFELKRQADSVQFAANADGSYSWREYKLVPKENGYTLFHNDDELYTSTFSQDKKLLKELRNWKSADEFYGFGEASRFVSLRNQSFTIYNQSNYGDHAYVFIPFYVTNKNTTVFINANGRDKIFFQDGNDAELYRSEYFRIESFVRQDSSIKESVQKFYAETQTACILPKWAYGYIQSKYGYKSADEVIQLVDDFKAHNIPLSAVVLDLYWFKKMGDISWTAPEFANHAEMEKHMEENGVKLITITEPFFMEDSVQYDELKSMNLLCKGKNGIALWRDWWAGDSKLSSGVFNPLGKNASKFMGKKYTEMLQSGIDGFWTDLGEPELDHKKVPADLKYGKYAEQDFHNYYNFYWSKALYEGVMALNPDKRLFIMSRSAGTGSGKFNVSVWSGDASVSWPSLGNQMAYGINAGISGLPYWGSDVGGFVQNNSPAELYTRWQQFGAFTPIYRAHGTGPREPYAYDEKTERIVADLIRTRMQLVPYIYSTARQTMQGIPMMRPMIYEDASTPQEFINSQYMFGDSILVAPVVKESSATNERQFWLPLGNWYNFYTMEKAKGGDSVSLITTIDNIPVYIKEGAIIPAEKDGKSYIFVAADAAAFASQIENTFTLYNDDGETEQYKSGAYGEIKFTLKGDMLSAEVSGNESFLQKEYTIALPAGKGKFTKKTVSLDDLKAGVKLQ